MLGNFWSNFCLQASWEFRNILNPEWGWLLKCINWNKRDTQGMLTHSLHSKIFPFPFKSINGHTLFVSLLTSIHFFSTIIYSLISFKDQHLTCIDSIVKELPGPEILPWEPCFDKGTLCHYFEHPVTGQPIQPFLKPKTIKVLKQGFALSILTKCTWRSIFTKHNSIGCPDYTSSHYNVRSW